MSAVNLFSGTGGWEVGADGLGLDITGIELDPAAHSTAVAAEHRSINASVLDLKPIDFDVEGFIASPPCQTFSMAGAGAGRQALDEVLGSIPDVVAGRHHALDHIDVRTLLVLEPLRWALEIRPRWIALEQVPPVLPIWQAYATVLRGLGYRVGTGIMHAEQHGVPQVRKRAILIANADGRRPAPLTTHSRYYRNGSMNGGVKPWVSMVDAIGWGYTDRPAMSLTSGNANGGPRLLDGGSGSWRTVTDAYEAGRWVRAPHRIDSPWNRGDLSTCSVQDGATLQSFPADYPWRGTVSEQCRQIGNAIPPLMARAALIAASGVEV